VDVSGCDVVDALVFALVVAVIEEGSDLVIKITQQKIIFQQDSVSRIDWAWVEQLLNSKLKYRLKFTFLFMRRVNCAKN
tara:strand:+ start:274 stop:510 length:237 start_codon:yes stop_codon:yes gene_type:complete